MGEVEGVGFVVLKEWRELGEFFIFEVVEFERVGIEGINVKINC